MNGTRSEAPPREFFNGRDPSYVLKSERPVHRAIAFLAAQGLSYIEVAERLGISPVTVQYVVKQPWCEAEILEIIHKNGGDQVALVLQAEALPSVKKLIEIRDSEESNKEVQRKAANDLLDRIYGKACQPILHRSEELEQLSDQELEAMVNRGKRN